jgi:hypothetical protein
VEESICELDNYSVQKFRETVSKADYFYPMQVSAQYKVGCVFHILSELDVI